MTTTAWGEASIVEEISIKRNTGGKAFATLVQLLEAAADLAKLGKALEKRPRLREALSFR